MTTTTTGNNNNNYSNNDDYSEDEIVIPSASSSTSSLFIDEEEELIDNVVTTTDSNTNDNDNDNDDDKEYEIVVLPSTDDSAKATEEEEEEEIIGKDIDPVVTPAASASISTPPAGTVTGVEDIKAITAIDPLSSPSISIGNGTGATDTITGTTTTTSTKPIIRKVYGSTFTPVNNTTSSSRSTAVRTAGSAVSNTSSAWNTPGGFTNNDNTPSSYATPPRNTTTTGSAGTGFGLSELSKQLRVYQAKNDGYIIEIDRLERQLRIVSDLQGISVHDLRAALQIACESEAHGELQHRVASLRAQLEAASILNNTSKNNNKSDANEESQSPTNNIGKSAAAAANSKIALLESEIINLQLRIGELEEIDIKRTDEKQLLYNKLFALKEENTQLQSQYMKSMNDIELLKIEIAAAAAISALAAKQKQQQEEQRDIASEVASLKPQQQKEIIPVVVPEEQDDTMQLLVLEQKNKIQQLEQQLIEYKKLVQLEKEKYILHEEQYISQNEEHKLRIAQYKARFVVQDERIKDVEQQLSSLYTAYYYLTQERDEEIQDHIAMRCNLEVADEQIARQVNNSENQNSNSNSNSSFRKSNFTFIPSPTQVAIPAKATLSPTGNNSSTAIQPPLVYNSTDASTTTYTYGEQQQELQQQNEFVPGERVMSGTMLIRSMNALGMKKWKKRLVTLTYYPNYYGFHIEKDTTYKLNKHLSRIEQYKKQQPLAIIVRTNFLDPNAPTLYVAAENKNTYNQWMTVFELTTTSSKSDEKVLLSTSTTIPNIYISPEDQEAMDIARAIEESEREQKLQEQQKSASSTSAVAYATTEPVFDDSIYAKVSSSPTAPVFDNSIYTKVSTSLTNQNQHQQNRYKNDNEYYEGVSEHKSDTITDNGGGDSSSSYFDNLYEYYRQQEQPPLIQEHDTLSYDEQQRKKPPNTTTDNNNNKTSTSTDYDYNDYEKDNELINYLNDATNNSSKNKQQYDDNSSNNLKYNQSAYEA